MVNTSFEGDVDVTHNLGMDRWGVGNERVC